MSIRSFCGKLRIVAIKKTAHPSIAVDEHKTRRMDGRPGRLSGQRLEKSLHDDRLDLVLWSRSGTSICRAKLQPVRHIP